MIEEPKMEIRLMLLKSIETWISQAKVDILEQVIIPEVCIPNFFIFPRTISSHNRILLLQI